MASTGQDSATQDIATFTSAYGVDGVLVLTVHMKCLNTLDVAGYFAFIGMPNWVRIMSEENASPRNPCKPGQASVMPGAQTLQPGRCRADAGVPVRVARECRPERAQKSGLSAAGRRTVTAARNNQ